MPPNENVWMGPVLTANTHFDLILNIVGSFGHSFSIEVWAIWFYIERCFARWRHSLSLEHIGTSHRIASKYKVEQIAHSPEKETSRNILMREGKNSALPILCVQKHITIIKRGLKIYVIAYARIVGQSSISRPMWVLTAECDCHWIWYSFVNACVCVYWALT